MKWKMYTIPFWEDKKGICYSTHSLYFAKRPGSATSSAGLNGKFMSGMEKIILEWIECNKAGLIGSIGTRWPSWLEFFYFFNYLFNKSNITLNTNICLFNFPHPNSNPSLPFRSPFILYFHILSISIRKLPFNQHSLIDL